MIIITDDEYYFREIISLSSAESSYDSQKVLN